MEGSVDEARQEEVALDVSRAIKYFMYNLQLLPQAYTGAETNRMTLCYFCVSALDLLGSLDKIRDKQTIIEWIYNLQIVPGNYKVTVASQIFGNTLDHRRNFYGRRV